VNLQDIYPTLIDLCNLPEREQIDGASILPLLLNPKEKWIPAVTTLGKGNHSVITEKWHYITRGEKAEELYDLEIDPMEWTNLAYKDTKEVHKIKSELKAYLKSYLPEEEVEPVAGGNVDKKDSQKAGKLGHDKTIKSTRAQTIKY